jgi:uncharacterized membrane-anchored protein
MRTALVTILVLTASLARAELPAPTEAEIDQLKPIRGPAKVTVGSDIASIDLPAGYSYLNQKDAQFWVERIWGNPHNPGVLGMVLQKPKDSESAPMGIIISYDDQGHVNDDDAGKLDFNELLKSMQDDTKSENPGRLKAGYPSMELVGWAEPPHYDGTSKKLYWAAKWLFSGTATPTLNYNVRILGRSGTLVMNAVAGVEQLEQAASVSKEILGVTEFSQGKRYADFMPSADKVAAVGIGGLIAGKLLLKVGFFAGALKLLAAFAKPLIALGAAGVAGVARIFGKKKKSE